MMSSFTKRCRAWIAERYPLQTFLAWAQKKSVPAGPCSPWLYLGGLTLFLFLVQLVTGILLMLYYKGTSESAFESIRLITTKVPFGWLIRSIHVWASDLIIFSAALHMFSTFFMRAYVKPRELTWLTGMGLMVILLAFGFSGYLLPWNELSFFATKVGTNMIQVIPWVGDALVEILRGGEEVSGATLQRFFAAHVIILPLCLILLMGVHLLMIQLQGMHEPESCEGQSKASKTIPFFPHFVLREVFLWCVILNILALLAFFYPAQLATEANEFVPAPEGIRPEWYFMWAYQVLKILPAYVGPLEGEVVGILFMSLGVLMWTLVPWIDRGQSKFIKHFVRVTGILLLLFLVLMTILGYWLP